MGVFNLRPARTAAEEVKIFRDLDQLSQEPMGFRYQGRVYKLQVGTVRRLTQMASKMERIMLLLQARANGEKVLDQEIYRAYRDYFAPICPEMTERVIESMNHRQLRALLKDFIRYSTGQTIQALEDEVSEASAEKKKTT